MLDLPLASAPVFVQPIGERKSVNKKQSILFILLLIHNYLITERFLPVYAAFSKLQITHFTSMAKGHPKASFTWNVGTIELTRAPRTLSINDKSEVTCRVLFQQKMRNVFSHDNCKNQTDQLQSHVLSRLRISRDGSMQEFDNL